MSLEHVIFKASYGTPIDFQLMLELRTLTLDITKAYLRNVTSQISITCMNTCMVVPMHVLLPSIEHRVWRYDNCMYMAVNELICASANMGRSTQLQHQRNLSTTTIQYISSSYLTKFSAHAWLLQHHAVQKSKIL